MNCSPYWDLYHYVEGWGSGRDSCQLAQYIPTEINVFWVAEGSATQNANIVQAVKKCYKIKNDYRELKSRFWWFFHSYSSHFWSFRASLLSKRTTFGMQGSPFCIAKRLQLYCKRSTFAMKCTPFSQSLVAYFERKACNVLCYSMLRKTAQNSRISS